EGLMARSSRESAVKARPAAAGGGNGKSLRNGKSAADARKELLERAGRNRDGASQWRSDPLADAQAARRVADLAQAHAAELSRRDRGPDPQAAATGALQRKRGPLRGRVRRAQGGEAGMTSALLEKKARRLKRRRRIRGKLAGTAERPRLSVYRSNRGVFAQLI